MDNVKPDIIFSPSHRFSFNDASAVHIWLLNLAELGTTEAFEHLLSPTELARAQTFRQRQWEFIATRIFMRLCLASYTGQAPGDLEIAAASSGKPYLTHSPLQFNLSHCADRVALAVSPNILGVDIEKQRKRSVMEIAQRYFHPSEVAQLEAADADNQQALFFKFWTLKEAFFKALGGGIATGLDKASFTFPRDTIQVSFAPELDQRERDWQFSQHKLHREIWLGLACRQQTPLAITWCDGAELFRF